MRVTAQGLKNSTSGTLDAMRILRVVVVTVGVLVSALLAVYGVILILYRGEARSEGDVDVEFGDFGVDADVLGIGLLVVAVASALLVIRFTRHG